MEYEVVDKNGNKKWISSDEASSLGLLKKDKKGKWMPAVGGTVGGIIGSILGPVGAAAGAAAGTGAGIAAQGAIYGDQNRTEGAYSGEKTKLGFQKLTPQGQRETKMGLLSDVKDVGVAGATGYIGAKIPGLGPAGKGVLPAVGRVATKTAASTALGAGTGFLAGDFGDTSMEERVSGAKTGAAVGGVLGFGGSVLQEGVNALKSSDIIKQLAKGKGLDKFNVPKAGGTMADEGAKKAGSFNRTQYYKSWFNTVQKSSDQNKLKMIGQIEKALSSETGVKIKGVGSMNSEQFSDLMTKIEKLDSFRKEIPMFDALLKRRDNASTLAKDWLGRLKQTPSNYAKLTQNTAYNEQLQKISGIKNGDNAVKSYYSVLNTLKKLGIISGIAGASIPGIGNVVKLADTIF